MRAGEGSVGAGERGESDELAHANPPSGRSRRRALETAGKYVATVALAGTGVLGYRVFDQDVFDRSPGAAYDPWRNWKDDGGILGTVAAAILAANPHNSQAWTFGVGKAHVDVFVDSRRRTGALDPFGREMHVGVGAALENLVVAARARGFVPTVSLFPSQLRNDLVARVRLEPGTPHVSPRYDSIGLRRTNRGPYDGRPVPLALLDRLVDREDLPESVQVRWVTSASEVAAMGQLMIDAATTITRDAEQSRESFAWFRSSNEEIQQHRDGLTLDGQGLSDLTLAVAKILPKSSRAGGDAFWIDQTRSVQTKTASAYGVIVVPNPYDRAAEVLGGRLLERIHLEATGRGIAVQHMNQITERIDRERAVGSGPEFASRFAGLIGTGRRPLTAFRVGYAERDARLSPRRALADVMR